MTRTAGPAYSAGGSHGVGVNDKAVAEVAMRVIYPSLICGTVFLQQPTEILPIIGQALIWVAFLAAAVIVFVVQRVVKVFFFLIISIAALRLARRFIGDLPEIAIGYDVATGLLFAVAGAAVISYRTEMLFHQMRALIFLSIPIMLLQIFGIGWSYALRTDGIVSAYDFGSLFRGDEGVGFNVLQLRPAGLMSASVFLSLVMLPTIALMFYRWRDSRLRPTDIAIAAVVVLAMSKILFLTLIVFLAVYLVAGPKAIRVRMVKLWGVIAGLLFLYAVSFPTAFEYNVNAENALWNFMTRLADVRASLTGLPMADVLLEDLEGTVLRKSEVEAGSQSGYARILRYWPVALSLSIVFGALLIQRFRVFVRKHPEQAGLVRNGLVATALAPLITSFISSPFFSFWAGGFVIIPFIVRAKRPSPK